MTTNPWKTTAPDEPGLYIASAERKARYVRYWTGVHWTAPLAVHDLHLTDRIPTAEGRAAATWKSHPIEWLEKVTIDADGFISWGRMLDMSPVAPDLLVEFRMADLRCSTPVPASLLTWGAGGSITAYRVVRDDADLIDKVLAKDFVEAFAPGQHLKEALAANEAKLSNPKDLVGVRKAPMSTVSAAVLAEVGVAMLEGAAKYGRHNYRAVGVRSSVYYDGTLRHIMAWWEGQDIDPDSGMHHITKAITSLVVLRDAMIQGLCEDDRPPRSPEFYAALNVLAGEIIDKHADKNPRHYTIADGRAA